MTDLSHDFSTTAGLVLAGGRSSRFGADKALADLGGKLLLECARRPLQHLPLLAVSAKAGSPVAAYAREHGTELVTDNADAPDGPLAGVLAGLEWAHARGFQFLASVPCDAPMLPYDLVAILLRGRGNACAAYAETRAGPHPLCAIWETSVRVQLAVVLARGEHPPVRAFLAAIGAAPVHFEATDAFANANTREVLRTLEKII